MAGGHTSERAKAPLSSCARGSPLGLDSLPTVTDWNPSRDRGSAQLCERIRL